MVVRWLGDWLIKWLDGRTHYQTDNLEERKEGKKTKMRHQTVIIYCINILTVEVIIIVRSNKM
jgi:hypothetical protein